MACPQLLPGVRLCVSISNEHIVRRGPLFATTYPQIPQGIENGTTGQLKNSSLRTHETNLSSAHLPLCLRHVLREVGQFTILQPPGERLDCGDEHVVTLTIGEGPANTFHTRVGIYLQVAQCVLPREL
jgi:hypothetical protein